jgi:phosphatidylserine decarboxylase
MPEENSNSRTRRRLGGWLPAQEDVLADFRREVMARAQVRSATTAPSSVVRELGEFIKRDAVLRMNLTRAIEQAAEEGYELGYRSIDELLMVIDYVTTYAPPFSESSSTILPLNGLLEWPMVMPSGYSVFRDAAFNRYMKRVLDTWCAFLAGPHSREHLSERSPDGWFCDKALKKTGMSDFLCDPGAPYWGFTSWNDFFTRRFKAGARPVHGGDDHRVVVNACEASAYALRHGVKLTDDFWIKSQRLERLAGLHHRGGGSRGHCHRGRA